MRILLAGFALALGISAEPVVLRSPGGAVQISFDVREGRPTYWVQAGSEQVIRPSALGLGAEGAARLASGFRIVRTTRAEARVAWKPVYGERSEVPDRYNAATVELAELIAPRRSMLLEFRAYDEGIAFRYTVPKQPGIGVLTVSDEATEFRLPQGSHAWVTPRAQELYTRIPVSDMRDASERPLLVEMPGGRWAAIAEAGVENFSSMFLAGMKADAPGVVARLLGPARMTAPFSTPWRVILIGNSPGELLERNYLLLNLSPPSRVKDTRWIRPGKVLREVTLSTRGGREAVDFAAKHGIQYIEYDAGWYGHEYDEESDATAVKVDPRRLRKEPEYQGLNLQQVIDYARSKDIGVWLYINRRAMERQLDTLLPLFRKWGVAGVKYGFVNVHTHEWTRWLYEAIAKAATHGLMLDIHDEFRPTGMSRTYPNLMTQEGILGNEGFPDATHSTVLAFTRMLAGAGDYTFCWLDPRLKNTWGHQLALSVVFYSPIQFVYWYDRPVSFEGRSAGMEWFRDVPTVWDETRVLGGAPGEFAAIARRRGADWFIGAITNNSERTVALRLDMLEAGRRYSAVTYSDGQGARDIRKTARNVQRGDTIDVALQARGGAALRLTPQ